MGAASRALNALGEIADKSWLDVLNPDPGISLDFMPMSSNPANGLYEYSFNDPFSSEWSEICLPGLDTSII